MGAELRLSTMSFKLITFKALGIGSGHFMTERWIQMWASLPLWKQNHFHLGLPNHSVDIFCIISLMDKAVLGFLILVKRLSPIPFSAWKPFFLYCPKIFHALTPPLTPSPIARIQEGSLAPGSAGGSRWQQQSMLGAVSGKISDRGAHRRLEF